MNRAATLSDIRRQIHALRIHEASELYELLSCVRSAVNHNSTDARLKAWLDPLDDALMAMDDDMSDDHEQAPSYGSERAELDARTEGVRGRG